MLQASFTFLISSVRYNFEVVDDSGSDRLAAGYVTVVCLDAAQFKATPLPDVIRDIIEKA